MSNLNLKPAFCFCFKNNLKTVGIFIAIMFIIDLIFTVSIVGFVPQGSMVGTFSAFESAAAITIFIIGIATVRDDMRLLIQNGIGRHTSFITEISVAAALSLILAVTGELFVTITQMVLSGHDQIQALSLYQMAFNHGALEGGFGHHLISIGMDFAIFLFAYLMGMLISLVFYRLPKPWKIVVAIGVPGFFFFVLPLLSLTTLGAKLTAWLSVPFSRIAVFATSGAGNYILVTLVICLIIALFCHLLMRRTPIK
jgi:hypothetical protein